MGRLSSKLYGISQEGEYRRTGRALRHYIDSCMRRDILYLHEPSCLRGTSPSDVIDANAGDLEKVEKHCVLGIGTQETFRASSENGVDQIWIQT